MRPVFSFAAAAMAMMAVAAPVGAQNLPVDGTGALRPDPMCMADVPWEVDPAASPIRVYGCRPLSAIPAPNDKGWVTYTRPLIDGTDAGSIMVRLVKQPTLSSWVFEVIDTTGGSGSFAFTVSGEADAQGYIQQPKVTILNSVN